MDFQIFKQPGEPKTMVAFPIPNPFSRLPVGPECICTHLRIQTYKSNVMGPGLMELQIGIFFYLPCISDN